MWATRFHTPCKTTGKIIVLYVLSFIFLDSKLKNKRFRTEWMQAFPDINQLLISSWIELWLYELITNLMQYLFVYFQLEMFRAYTPIFRSNGCYNILHMQHMVSLVLLGVSLEECVCWWRVAVQHATSTRTPQDQHLTTPRTPYAAYVKKL